MSAGDALRVTLRLDADRISGLRIDSPRIDAAPLFIGRTPDEAVTLAKNLFSLCPMAQSHALRTACEGAAPSPDAAARRAREILCERYGEMLRASVLDWPQEALIEAASIADLRASLSGLRLLSAGKREALEGVSAAAARLGLREFSRGKSPFARQWRAAAESRDVALNAVAPDFLTPAADEAVAQAMSAPAFARAPALAGRSMETGALARRGDARNSGLPGRLAARFADMAATLDAIGALFDGAAPPPGLICSGRTGPDEGFAAVESARGRLYHGVRLGADGRIAACRIVAPTEWNFHPDGPFVRLLRGARIGGGPAAAKLLVERLAFVFDPCIRVGVTIEEPAHA